MSKLSSSLYSRLHGIFKSSPTSIPKSNNRNKPKNLIGKTKKPSTSPASSAAASAAGDGERSSDAKEKILREKLENFKKSCECNSFRQVNGFYAALIRRLKKEGKFSMIDEALQYQKKFENIKSEGFVIRMILLYGYSRMTDHAHKLFDEMPQLHCERSIKSFNALLSAYVNSSKYDEAMKMFRELPEKLGVIPDLVSYNTMIKGFCRKPSLDKPLLSLFNEMEKNGLEPDIITFNTLFEAFYRKGLIEEGDKLWDLMESKNIVPNIRSYNAKIRGLAMHKKIIDAISLIDDMKSKGISPDIHTYTALIKTYHGEDNLDEVMKWYTKLKENGLEPDVVTYCLIIPFLCLKGDLDTAVKLSKDAIEKRVLSRPSMFKPVLQGLIDRGNFDEAKELVINSNLQGYFWYIPELSEDKK